MRSPFYNIIIYYTANVSTKKHKFLLALARYARVRGGDTQAFPPRPLSNYAAHETQRARARKRAHARTCSGLVTPLEKVYENNKKVKVDGTSESLRIASTEIRKCVFCYSHFTKCTFLKNNCKKICVYQKKAVSLHQIYKTSEI